MDSREFAEWVAYCRIDPFGNERADLHAAMIVAMLYNTHSGKHAAKSPSDFMPDWGKSEPAPDESMRSLFRIAAESLPRKEDKWQEAHS